jgi:hypothetical protein
MKNEPVAWMQVSAIDGTPMKASLVQTWDDDIPLYTHPAKTLTDEEIVNLINKHIDYVPDNDGMKVVGLMDLCRAILRKAQNK